MALQDAKHRIEAVEHQLEGSPFVVACTFERNGQKLNVALTDRLRRACKRGRVWKSKAFLTAFKNAAYGFDPSHAASPGGSDGIFVLTRDHVPKNTMMTKIFDQFLDTANGSCDTLAAHLGVNKHTLVPVRLVSHHMRLLGVLLTARDEDLLVLVDYDDSKG